MNEKKRTKFPNNTFLRELVPKDLHSPHPNCKLLTKNHTLMDETEICLQYCYKKLTILRPKFSVSW